MKVRKVVGGVSGVVMGSRKVVRGVLLVGGTFPNFE